MDEWSKEFAEFMKAPSVQPPIALNEKIHNFVNHDLNPSAWNVFSKLALIQILVGSATLLFCPQFGYSPTGLHGIMHIFMRFGMEVCMAACGGVFVGSSLLVAAFALKPQEVRVLRSHRLLQITTISFATVGAFLCLGAEVFEYLTLAWIVGSIIGGICSLELGWSFRSWISIRTIYE